MEKTETKTGRKYSEKEIKRMAVMAEVWNDDPEFGGLMLGQRLGGAAKNDDDLDEVVTCDIHRLSLGSAYLWKELTGDELTSVGSHLMGLIIYAGALEAAIRGEGEPFDPEEWLRNAWEGMRSQMDKEMDDDLAEYYYKCEMEQARQRLAAIKGGCDE